MIEEKQTKEFAVPNRVSPHTGEFDARFLLWRTFCAEYGISAETLPSDLTDEAREKWEKIKNENLHKPYEEGK